MFLSLYRLFEKWIRLVTTNHIHARFAFLAKSNWQQCIRIDSAVGNLCRKWTICFYYGGSDWISLSNLISNNRRAVRFLWPREIFFLIGLFVTKLLWNLNQNTKPTYWQIHFKLSFRKCINLNVLTAMVGYVLTICGHFTNSFAIAIEISLCYCQPDVDRLKTD